MSVVTCYKEPAVCLAGWLAVCLQGVKVEVLSTWPNFGKLGSSKHLFSPIEVTV